MDLVLNREAIMHKVLKNFIIICALGVAVAWLNGTVVSAQSSTATKEAKSLELEAVGRQLEEARERQRALREEIAALDRDVGAINRALVETAKRGQELEALVSNSEARLDSLVASQSTIQKSLNAKRGLLSEVLASLQRLGKNPPPALFIRPQDALASVRSSILLSAVVPTIKQESDTLFAELSALKATSDAVVEEKKTLAKSLNALAEDETRLSLLVEEKNQLANKSRTDLQAEQSKSADLASKALSLKQFIKDLESQISSATQAAKSARNADQKRRIAELKRLEKARKQLQSKQQGTVETNSPSLGEDMTRIEPAIAFSQSKGKVLLPVSGIQIAGFGAVHSGARRTDVTFVTRPNARVRAPSDGWVVYAGPFRSYGNIIILNAGEDYHIVLSGLSHINVTPGRFVLAGEPIGRMGATRIASANAANLGSNKPILSVELRKDSKPIDPGPWWASKPSTNIQISARNGT